MGVQGSTDKTLVDSATQRFAVTFPASGFATLLDLLVAAGYSGKASCVVYVSGNLPGAAATPRPAIVCASKRVSAANFVESDFTTHGEVIGEGIEYHTPSTSDAANTAIRGVGGAVAGLVVVLD